MRAVVVEVWDMWVSAVVMELWSSGVQDVGREPVHGLCMACPWRIGTYPYFPRFIDRYSS